MYPSKPSALISHSLQPHSSAPPHAPSAALADLNAGLMQVLSALRMRSGIVYTYAACNLQTLCQGLQSLTTCTELFCIAAPGCIVVLYAGIILCSKWPQLYPPNISAITH